MVVNALYPKADTITLAWPQKTCDNCQKLLGDRVPRATEKGLIKGGDLCYTDHCPHCGRGYPVAVFKALVIEPEVPEADFEFEPGDDDYEVPTGEVEVEEPEELQGAEEGEVDPENKDKWPTVPPTATASMDPDADPLKCLDCDYGPAKSKAGLETHRRSKHD